jgi:putative ABC transport system permease protein
MRLHRWLNALPLRVRSIFRRQQLDRDLDREIQAHLELTTDEKIAQGMSVDEARRTAKLELGGVEQVKEAVRAARAGAWLDTLLQDVRFGIRVLRKNPGFTAVAVLTLALGIGANTAIFTVIEAVLLHPLPYPGADRIVQVTRHDAHGTISVPMFDYFEQNGTGLEDLTAILSGIGSNLADGRGTPALVEGIRVSRNYFRLFGASLILGRIFSAQEDQPGGPGVVVISYGLWQSRYGGDPSILDKAVMIGGSPYAIIGVLSPSFRSYPAADIWMPLQANPNSTNQAHILTVAARLPTNTTSAESNATMRAIGERYVDTHPLTLGGDDDLRVIPVQQALTGDVRTPLFTLVGAVALVLLMACANVAGLLLARATTRQKEIAIRAALGAGRGRMLRQLLTESLILAVAGASLGLVIGPRGVRVLVALEPNALPRTQDIASIPALNAWVTAFAALLAFVTTVLFGLFPAMRLSHTDLANVFNESSGRASIGLRQRNAHSAFVGAQLAIAVVLLCGATLLMRSFVVMHEVNLGFDPHNVLTMEVSLAGAEYSKSSNVDQLARRIVNCIEGIPGVDSAALASALPLRGQQDMIFDIPNRPGAGGRKFLGDVQWRIVSPDYFRVLRIPLLSGRLLTAQEPGRTAVISETMARQYWPHDNPVGQAIVVGPGLGSLSEGRVEIVGVVGDVREGLDRGPWSVIYQTPLQIPDSAMALVNRLSREAVIIRTKASISPMRVGWTAERDLETREGLAATKLRTMKQLGMDSTARQNFTLILFSVFAAIAMLLAAVGIYGVVSYLVNQRTHEIGIRMALGAQPGDILGDVLWQGGKMALAGIGLGVAASFGLTRLMKSLLFGVSADDPLTLAAVVSALLCVALLACWIPARRAMRVDPMAALRHE